MKNKVISLSAIVIALLTSNLPLTAENEEIAGYLFMGGDLSAQHRKAHLPVVSVNKKHILLDNGANIKKVSRTAPCRLTRNIVLSEDFVEVIDLDYTFTSMAALKAHSQAISDGFFMEASTELEVNRIQGELDRGGDDIPEGERLRMEGEIRELNYSNDNVQSTIQDMIETDSFYLEGKKDMVFFDFEILPSTDIKDAYCAVVISFEPETPEDAIGNNTFVRVRYLGDLLANRGQKVKFSSQLLPFPDENVECEVHIYSNEKGQVATNLAKGLKPMTSAQMKRYQELASLRN